MKRRILYWLDRLLMRNCWTYDYWMTQPSVHWTIYSVAKSMATTEIFYDHKPFFTKRHIKETWL